MRALLSVAVTEVATTNSAKWVQRLSKLSPPFGSWSSQPSYVDDWIDPADEMSVDADKLPWEAQVSCVSARGYLS